MRIVTHLVDAGHRGLVFQQAPKGKRETLQRQPRATALHGPPSEATPSRSNSSQPCSLWINTVISNLKTSISGTFHVLNFEKYADRYLGAFCYRFNRRFNLEEMTGRILRATCNCTARPKGFPRGTEFGTH